MNVKLLFIYFGFALVGVTWLIWRLRKEKIVEQDAEKRVELRWS